MLLMDSFSCKVKITSLNTEGFGGGGRGRAVNVQWRLQSTTAALVNNYRNLKIAKEIVVCRHCNRLNV